MPDWYSVLAVDPQASRAEIRQAFRAAALKHHPDKSNTETGDQFDLVHAAFDVLSDPQRRAEYDASLGLYSPLLAAQQRQREQKSRSERQYFAAKLAEQQARSVPNQTKQAEPTGTRDELLQQSRSQDNQQSGHSVDERTLEGSSMPFETVAAARAFVDANPGSRLKASKAADAYTELYESETLERIERRRKVY